MNTKYCDVCTIVVSDVNDSILSEDEDLKKALERKDELDRIDLERHGAIRLGSADELRMMRRFLGTMNMASVGYYDLTQAGLPIHATCFRATDPKALSENPLRLFVSLLRPEFISPKLRSLVREILSKRQIFSKRVKELILTSEKHGGLTIDEAGELVVEGIQTFRWRGQATVSEAVYKALLAENPILADIVAFQGPHTNHLTPRVLDIDRVQACMHHSGLPTKQSIEGPPRRKNPILLRQTSYYAQGETITYSADDGELAAGVGSHTARFGETKERGAALSPKGRSLYDTLLESAMVQGISAEQEEAYARHFADFPDDWATMRKQGLVWSRYSVIPEREAQGDGSYRAKTLEDLIAQGVVRCEPIIYEDFLPISAAGIFQSNLKNSGKNDSTRPKRIFGGECTSRLGFEGALGGKVLDEMDLYRALQEASLAQVYAELDLRVVSRLKTYQLFFLIRQIMII